MYVCVHSCLQVHIVDRMTWKINYTTAHLRYVSQTNYGIYTGSPHTKNSFHKLKIVMFYESITSI